MSRILINYLSGLMNPLSDIFGISRYQSEIHKQLKNKIELNWINYNQGFSNIFDYYIKYPLIIKNKVKKDNITHFPNPWYAHIINYIDFNKIIVTLYDVEPSIMFSNFKTSIHWSLCFKGIKKSNKIITISEYSKREIIKFLGYKYPSENIEIVYEGVDKNFFKKIKNDKNVIEFKERIGLNKSKIFLFIGSEQPRKNFKNVLFALYKFKKKFNENFILLKIGKPESNDYRKENIEIVKKLGLENNVIFKSSIPDKELVLYYNISDCLLIPTFYEGGFALPILEAFACETPVITSKIPPILELTEGKGAIFVDPINPDEIAYNLINIVNKNIDINSLIDEGLTIVNKYDWKKSAEKFYQIYRDLDIK